MASHIYQGDLGVVVVPFSMYHDGTVRDFTYYGRNSVDLSTNTSVYSKGMPADMYPEVFLIDRGGQQPQVVITYQRPESYLQVDAIRLLRKPYTYSINEDDGDIVFEDSLLDEGEQYLSDLTVESKVPYFYTVYIYTEGQWKTYSKMQKSIICYEGGFFRDKLWEAIPRRTKRRDSAEDYGAITKPIFEQSSFGKTYHVGKIGEYSEGQLQRCLSFFGLEFDDVKGKIDLMLECLRDPDRTTDDLLPYIASLIGLDLNREFSVDRQRKEITSTVAMYKKKGTISGFISATRSVSGVAKAEVIEYGDFLLCSNNVTRLSARTLADFPDIYLDEFGNIDVNKIVNARSYSELFRPSSFELRLFTSDEDSITGIMLKKLQRLVKDFSPVCTTGFISTLAAVLIENPYINVGEVYYDNSEDKYTEEIVTGSESSSYYMISALEGSTPTSLSNYFGSRSIYSYYTYNLSINSTDSASKTINVTGDAESIVSVGHIIKITGATTSGVNGVYVVTNVVYNDPDSDIVVSSYIPNSTSEGDLEFGSYHSEIWWDIISRQ